MDFIQFVGEVVVASLKHGWSLTTIAIVVMALLRFEPFRQAMMRYLPRKLRKIDNRMDRIEAKQDTINAKLDILLSERGLTWDAHYLNTPNLSNGTISQKKRLLSWLMAQFRARTIGVCIWQTVHLHHFKTEREFIQMKNKLLSRKFLMAVIAAALVIANDGLNLGLDQNTIIAFGSIVVGWIIGESAVDVAKKPVEVKYNGLDSAAKDSEGA